MFCKVQAKIDRGEKVRGSLLAKQLLDVTYGSSTCLTQSRTAFSHGLRIDRKALERLQAPPEEAKEAMSKLPAGWDEDRVKRVIRHYESQSEDEAVAEDEAAFAVDEILVQVPVELVPKVRALIAKEQAKR